MGNIVDALNGADDMNNEITMNNEVTMTSKEIAELTGKQHGHVLRDIEKLLNELELAQSKFGVGYLDKNNQERKMYKLPRDLVENLLMGYSAKLRQAVIKRLRELESQLVNNQPKLPTNFADALLLAGEIEKERQLLEAKVEEDAPMVELGKKFVEAKAYLKLNEAAKQLGQAPHAFNIFLQDQNLLMKCPSSGALLPMQNSINNGWMVVHTAHRYHSRTGEKINTSSTRITSKGLALIIKRLGQMNIDVYGMMDEVHGF